MLARSNPSKACVTLALARLRAVALAEKRQRLLEHKAQANQYMQSIVERLEVERAKMRVLKEVSSHLS